MMLDKEYLKTVVKAEWDRYAVAFEKLNKPTIQESETLRQYYERRERLLKGRAEGMEDLIYDIGYLVLHLPNGDIDIIERFDK